MQERPRHHRRSFVLISVLLIVGSALLVTTSLLFVAQADLAGEVNAIDGLQSRALAWSGVRVVMNRLNEQRDRILDGELPRLESEYVIYEAPRRLGLVRLLEVTPAGDLLAPEAGKLDLNEVDAAMLAETGFLDDELARKIISYRDQTLRRPYQSVAELLRVPGITPETLYGPLDDITLMDEATGAAQALTDRVAERLGGTEPRGLADLLTVYGFEPALQRDGKLRINLNVPWSDELARRVDQRFGQGASQMLKQIIDSGNSLDSEPKIFEALRTFDTPPEDWPDIIDAVTTESGDYHFGRLDINSASYESLLALPEIDAEQAAQLIRTRDSLSSDERATIAWPAIAGILEPEAYDALAGKITTRCWTFRIRLAAGEVDADDPESGLSNPVIYEVVVDLSSPQTRVAYLRDITLLQTAAMLTANEVFESEEVDDEEASTVAEADEDGVSGAPEDEIDDTDPDVGAAADAGEERARRRPRADRPRRDRGNGRSADDDLGSSGTPATSDSSSRRRRVGRWLSGR